MNVYKAIQNNVTVFQNVCITMNSIDDLRPEMFKAFLTSYDINRDAMTTSFQIQSVDLGKQKSAWIVDNLNTTMPPDWKIEESVAYFPAYLRDSMNIFLFWHRTLTSQFALVSWSKTNLNKSFSKLPKTLIATSLRNINKSFQDTINLLGFDYLVDYESRRKSGSTCFRAGVFGLPQNTKEFEKPVIKEVFNIWNMDKEECIDYYVVIVQRVKTRRILDADFIKHLLEG